ncbi:hypothetical protein I4U23_023060 [Adineta vaga]|nr:hypothetical protein I4U23_023060 [Adineta vaga]
MLYSRVLFYLLIIVIAQSVHGSYHYIGCYQQVFYDSYFESSYMEPKLCFLLCETPIIFIQGSICRCSWSGLMDHNQGKNSECSIRCPMAGYSKVKSNNLCGGSDAYSAYAENPFFTKHLHLLNYKIEFRACKFRNVSADSDIIQVKIDETSSKLGLNKLERCAAACLDRNTTTESIAFNGDNNQCSCIKQNKLNIASNDFLNSTALSNDRCNLYCNNIFGDSNIEHMFKCGSTNDSRIWAIYDLSDLCPIGYVYVREQKACMTVLDSCPSGTEIYAYDGNITWDSVLKIIEKFNSTKSSVRISFTNRSNINPKWACSSTYSYNSDIISSVSYDRTYYTIKDGCLRSQEYLSYYSYTYTSSSKLCIMFLTAETQSSYDIIRSYYRYEYTTNQKSHECPKNWLDLNNHCYQISDRSKTIQEAKNSCFTVLQMKLNIEHEDEMKPIFDDTDDNEFIYIETEKNDEGADYDSKLHGSEIVPYSAQWQGRLGFFLLDTNISSSALTVENIQPVKSKTNVTRVSINEFQMINADNSTSNNDSCLVFTRSTIDDIGSIVLTKTSVSNCSKPRRVLCATKTIIGYKSLSGCFQKPLAIGLPSVISNHLTHKLCLSICRKLETRLAVLQMNRCYCLNYGAIWLNKTSSLHSKYKKLQCGRPCPGNKHEQCGDENTIIVYNLTISLLSSYDYSRITESNPPFSYDSCIYLHSINPSTMYQFNIKHAYDTHPRHCLEICNRYNQSYALLNSNKCLCTNNLPPRRKPSNVFKSQDLSCNRECPGNYFHTCGAENNASIYSTYALKLSCPTGFIVNDDKKRCMFDDTLQKAHAFPDAQSHCKSIDSTLAKVNDILEIQDILSSSAIDITRSVTNSFDMPDRKKHFWVDRASNFMNTSQTSNRAIQRCSKTSDSFDPHCIVLSFERIQVDNKIDYERCLTESNECPSESAMPVCVHKHWEPNSTVIRPIEHGSSLDISVKTTIDYTCGDDEAYYLINDYCYKVNFHETTWNEAKAECTRDNATLFIPETSATITMIKEVLLSYRRIYVWSGIAHVNVIYDNQKHTVVRYNTKNKNTQSYSYSFPLRADKCESTFRSRFQKLTPHSKSELAKKKTSNSINIGCGSFNFRSEEYSSFSCADIGCEQLAAVICQKLPIEKSAIIQAKRISIDGSTNDMEKGNKSVSRNHRPVFFILSIISAVVLLVLGTIWWKKYHIKKKAQNDRRTANSFYSPISTMNEFDMD